MVLRKWRSGGIRHPNIRLALLTMMNPVVYPDRPNLIGLTSAQVAQLPVLAQEPPFRVRQVVSWVYARGSTSFEEMTNLPKQLRARLAESSSLERIPVVSTKASSDGSTHKFLFNLRDGIQIEAVLIRADRRDTICISTQAGCAYGCRFCATGAMGLKRNLTPHEILSQVMVVRDEIWRRGGLGHFNLVFMGMGEPLANYAALLHSIQVLNEDHGMAVGRRRMTVSTVGLLPEIRRFARVQTAVRLALSLNATTNETRTRLMPINRRYPIEQLLPALSEYGRATGNRVTIEYILIKGLNDSMQDARRLGAFARESGCKINLIVFNPHPLTDLEPSPPEIVRRFHDTLLPISPTVTLRESKGVDILAACGQLSTAYGNRRDD